MKPTKALTALICATSVMLSGPAMAEKKPWDFERYRDCSSYMPTDELDTSVTVTSYRCKQTSQHDPRGVRITELTVDPFFLSARPVSEKAWTHSLVLNAKYSRINNMFADGGYSPARFNHVVFLVDGQQVSKPLDLAQVDRKSCETYRAFGTASTTCPFNERLAVAFTPDQIFSLRNAAKANPSATMRMRISADNGESFDVTVDLIEMEAVVGKAEQN